MIQDALLSMLWRLRRVLGAAVLAGLAVSALHAFLAPSWYEAELVVVLSTPQKGSGVFASAAAAMVPEMVLDSFAPSADAQRIVATFHSRTVTDAIINRFQVLERYQVKTLEDARKELWNHCTVTIDRKSSFVSLTCEDKVPAFVQQMVAAFAEEGDKVFRRISQTSAGEERQFLEKHVAQTREHLAAASSRLRAFQEKHHIIDLPEQARAVVSSLAKLNDQVMSTELELGYRAGFSRSDESTAGQLNRQISVLESKARALAGEAGQAPTAPSPGGRRHATRDIFPALSVLPQLRAELEEIFREQKIQETMVLLLTQRLELARVNEARDTSAFQVVDAPVLPSKRSSPKRVRVFIIDTGLTVLLFLMFGATPLLRRARAKQDAVT